eukprot:gene3200-7015_t
MYTAIDLIKKRDLTEVLMTLCLGNGDRAQGVERRVTQEILVHPKDGEVMVRGRQDCKGIKRKAAELAMQNPAYDISVFHTFDRELAHSRNLGVAKKNIPDPM